jgi:hypothetical protein
LCTKTVAADAYEPAGHEAAIRMTVQQGGIFCRAAETKAVLAGLPQPANSF